DNFRQLLQSLTKDEIDRMDERMKKLNASMGILQDKVPDGETPKDFNEKKFKEFLEQRLPLPEQEPLRNVLLQASTFKPAELFLLYKQDPELPFAKIPEWEEREYAEKFNQMLRSHLVQSVILLQQTTHGIFPKTINGSTEKEYL